MPFLLSYVEVRLLHKCPAAILLLRFARVEMRCGRAQLAGRGD
jgi:hypothetical protein